MLSIDVSHAVSFLSLPYEAALRPRLERAAGWLQNGGGKGSDFIGWVTLPRDYDRGEYARILAAAKKIQGDSKALVVIGIGGSYLGARGVIECLCSPNYNLKKKSTPNIYFIGNGLSSDALREVTELIGDDDFSVNVISKSGTTTEPAVAFRFFREKLEKKYGKEEAFTPRPTRTKARSSPSPIRRDTRNSSCPTTSADATACSPPLVFSPSPSRALIWMNSWAARRR